MTGKGVLVDGVALPATDADALWQRFSDWMEENRGDLAGFAKKEGFASVHPAVQGGRPVLVASKTAAQRPYAPARAAEDHEPRDRVRSGGGSPSRQPERRNPDQQGRNPGRPPGKGRK